MPVAASRSAAPAKAARRAAARSRGDEPPRSAPPRAARSRKDGATATRGRAAKDRSRPATRSRQAPGRLAPGAVRAIVPVSAGMVWAVVLLAAVASSAVVGEVVLVPVAVVAAASTVRAVAPKAAARKRGGRPGGRSRSVIAAAVTAAAVPLAALGGATPFVVALVVFGGVAVVVCVASVVNSTARPTRPAMAMLVAALGPALAGGSVIVARGQGANEAVALVAAILAYDAGAFVMGHGRTPLGGPVGVAGGMISVAVVAVFVAAAIDPPFSGMRPWVLFGFVAVLAPIGVAAVSALTGGDRLPALRRLDSLVLAGPAWAIGVALLLHR